MNWHVKKLLIKRTKRFIRVSKYIRKYGFYFEPTQFSDLYIIMHSMDTLKCESFFHY